VQHHIKEGIFLLLGTNLGLPLENLQKAKHEIEEKAGAILRSSSIYKTAAWGNIRQPDFYNLVIEINTALTPPQLLEKILAIETLMGRQRFEKWGPRIMDIDMLFYHQVVSSTATLKLPHPGIPERNFTLIPLAEIAPLFWHPVLQKTVQTLLAESRDSLPVKLFNESI
jgi:2-amino-4-hydroxy-6-hydroxymethyldihydropteridine diphosphokinase